AEEDGGNQEKLIEMMVQRTKVAYAKHPAFVVAYSKWMMGKAHSECLLTVQAAYSMRLDQLRPDIEKLVADGGNANFRLTPEESVSLSAMAKEMADGKAT